MGIGLLAAGLALMEHAPMVAPLGVFAGFLFLWGRRIWESARVVMAMAAILIHAPEAQLGLLGLLLIGWKEKEARSDEACVGWGILLGAFLFVRTVRHDSLPLMLFSVAGTFLVAGVWPATGSWLFGSEGWGRRVARGALALSLLGWTLPRIYPVSFDAWAPLLIFLPGMGVLWAAGLAASEAGRRAPLSLLWFFELQLMMVFVLGSRWLGIHYLPLALWAALLPVICLVVLTTPRKERQGGFVVHGIGLVPVASLLALPGLVGFAYRWVALSSMLNSSPAGFVVFVLALLVAPVFLRPVRAQLREASLEGTAWAVCLVAVLGIVLFGLYPGLYQGTEDGAWIWEYLSRLGESPQ